MMMMILLINFAAHLWTGNVQQRGYYHVFITLKQGVPCSANELKLSPKTLFSLMPERKGNGLDVSITLRPRIAMLDFASDGYIKRNRFQATQEDHLAC